jgi:hypothetical protein
MHTQIPPLSNPNPWTVLPLPHETQVLLPPQADGTSSRLQGWLTCGQLPWLLQAAGALLAHAEGRPEATDLQVWHWCPHCG